MISINYLALLFTPAAKEANYTIIYEVEYDDATGDVDAANFDAYIEEMPTGVAESSDLLENLCEAAMDGVFQTAPVISGQVTRQPELSAGNVRNIINIMEQVLLLLLMMMIMTMMMIMKQTSTEAHALNILFDCFQIIVNYTIKFYPDDITDSVVDCVNLVNAAFGNMLAFSAVQPIYKIQPDGLNQIKVLQDSVTEMFSDWTCPTNDLVEVDPHLGRIYCSKYRVVCMLGRFDNACTCRPT